MASLLPPNSTRMERHLAEVTADMERAEAPIDTIWDARRIPAHMLPWLGWAVGVDQWDSQWPEQTRRDAIEIAIPVRRLRGTALAVRRALEAIGYSEVEILEHARQDAEWRAAGGRYLDESWLLDGRPTLGSDLVDPPRVVTAHWAQYALAFNMADAPFTARDQRRLRDRAQTAAPLRAELIALIYRFGAAWGGRITVSDLANRVRMRHSDCRGARVHRARPLMGCWSLSGDYAPSLLDGSRRLRGHLGLTGRHPVGEPLDHGWGTAGIRLRQHSGAGMQSRADNAWTLGESHADIVDGSWALNETVDGHRRIGGDWGLELGRLHRLRRPLLDGNRNLGASQTIPAIGTTGRAVLRDRRLRTEICL